MKIEIDETELTALVRERAVEIAAKQLAEDIVTSFRGRQYRDMAKDAIKAAVEKNMKLLLDSAASYAGDKIVRDGKRAGLISLKEILERSEKFEI